MSDELLPCPFCGHLTPIEVQSFSAIFAGWLAHIHCPDCGANGPESMPMSEQNRAALAAASYWNRRA